MIRVLVLLILISAPAAAAPALPPFVVYHSPAPRCDVRPVAQACRNAELRDWREFLAHKSPYFLPVTKVRLADLHDHTTGTVEYGWTFRLIVPTPPARWRQLAITIGGVAVGTGQYDRHVRSGTLVVDVVIFRSQLAPGTHRVDAKVGSEPAFLFDLELEGSNAPPPVDPKQLAADSAAAAQRLPFLVTALPLKPDCNPQPRPAGCSQSIANMWNGLFNNKLAGHAHATKFARTSRPDAAGNPIWHWHFYLVFPTSPVNWLDRDLVIEIDRKQAPYSHRYKVVGTEALQVELTLLEANYSAGKHEVRAIERSTGNMLFSSETELVK